MSGIAYSRERIRLEVDVRQQTPATDRITAASPAMWRGTDLGIEAAFMFEDALIDISAYSSITCEIRDSETRSSRVLATLTLGAAELNPDLTSAQWQAGTHQHAVFHWTHEDTRWDLQGGMQRTYWVVISAITTDTPPRRVTLGCTNLTVHEDGAGESENSPEPGDPLYLTATQTEALIGQVIRPGTNPAGTTILLVSPNGQWGRLLGVNDDGSAQDAIISLS